MSLKSKNLNFLQVLQYIKKAEKEKNKEDRIQFTLGEMDNSVVMKNKRLK
jgi:predicted nuclease of restriction endonuclease-like (RecB) superfamily